MGRRRHSLDKNCLFLAVSCPARTGKFHFSALRFFKNGYHSGRSGGSRGCVTGHRSLLVGALVWCNTIGCTRSCRFHSPSCHRGVLLLLSASTISARPGRSFRIEPRVYFCPAAFTSKLSASIAPHCHMGLEEANIRFCGPTTRCCGTFVRAFGPHFGPQSSGIERHGKGNSSLPILLRWQHSRFIRPEIVRTSNDCITG